MLVGTHCPWKVSRPLYSIFLLASYLLGREIPTYYLSPYLKKKPSNLVKKPIVVTSRVSYTYLVTSRLLLTNKIPNRLHYGGK